MAATVQSLREILLTVEPPKILIDRATEIPMLREDLLQRLKKATTREEGIAISEEAKLDMVNKKTYFPYFKTDYLFKLIIQISPSDNFM